jgi:hypothetical protein
MSYLITIIDNSEARVTSDGIGYCESFCGATFKADAIRYIKRVGGKNATFSFVDFKYEIIGNRG